MSYLVISARTPRLSSGTGLRTYGVVAALARHAEVELAYVEFGGGAAAAEFERLPGVRLRRLRASRGARRVAAFARSRAQRMPADLARGVSPELISAGTGAPAGVRVVADGPVAAGALMRVARRHELTYLAHNLESSGFRPQTGQASLERFERELLSTFSETWMATRADEEGARRLVGGRVSTRYVPNVVDTDLIAPVPPAGSETVLFVADFTYHPNREAFEFLTAEVLPELWQWCPDVRLVAVGRGLEPTARDSRISTPGFVPSLRSAYAAAAVVAVPLLRGGGSPLKFIEALSYGLPIVATTHAATLLEDGQPGRDFLAASDAGPFAAAIRALLTDRAQAVAVGAAGRELAVGRYSVGYLAGLLAPPVPV